MNEVPISPEEREQLIRLLTTSRESLRSAVAACSPAPTRAEGRPGWSPAEIVEHLVATETAIFARLQTILALPPDATRRSALAARDATILKAVPDRSRRVEAPSQLKPALRFPNLDTALATFESARLRTIELAESTQLDLRSRFDRHPFLREMDAYQWLLFLAVHTDRHVSQLRESASKAVAAAE